MYLPELEAIRINFLILRAFLGRPSLSNIYCYIIMANHLLRDKLQTIQTKLNEVCSASEGLNTKISMYLVDDARRSNANMPSASTEEALMPASNSPIENVSSLIGWFKDKNILLVEEGGNRESKPCSKDMSQFEQPLKATGQRHGLFQCKNKYYLQSDGTLRPCNKSGWTGKCSRVDGNATGIVKDDMTHEFVRKLKEYEKTVFELRGNALDRQVLNALDNLSVAIIIPNSLSDKQNALSSFKRTLENHGVGDQEDADRHNNSMPTVGGKYRMKSKRVRGKKTKKRIRKRVKKSKSKHTFRK